MSLALVILAYAEGVDVRHQLNFIKAELRKINIENMPPELEELDYTLKLDSILNYSSALEDQISKIQNQYFFIKLMAAYFNESREQLNILQEEVMKIQNKSLQNEEELRQELDLFSVIINDIVLNLTTLEDNFSAHQTENNYTFILLENRINVCLNEIDNYSRSLEERSTHFQNQILLIMNELNSSSYRHCDETLLHK